MRVDPGQKSLQVTRNLQLADQTTLLRDQVKEFNFSYENNRKFKNWMSDVNIDSEGG